MGTTFERMKDHPAASIFPLMDGQPFADLKADIRDRGLEVPIEVCGGKIIDGRNRYRACVALGIEPDFVEVEPEDPIAYVLSLNLHRRHLTETQRAVVGARAMDAWREQAKARQRAGGGDKRSAKAKPRANGSLVANLPQAVEPSPKVRDRAAEALNVSPRSVQSAAKAIAKGVPELVAAMERDEIPVSVAVKVADLPKAEQRKALRGGKQAVRAAAATVAKREKPPHDAAVRALDRINTILGDLTEEIGTPSSAVKSSAWRSEESKGILARVAKAQRALAKWESALSPQS